MFWRDTQHLDRSTENPRRRVVNALSPPGPQTSAGPGLFGTAGRGVFCSHGNQTSVTEQTHPGAVAPVAHRRSITPSCIFHSLYMGFADASSFGGMFKRHHGNQGVRGHRGARRTPWIHAGYDIEQILCWA